MSTMADLDVKKLHNAEAEKEIESSEPMLKEKLEAMFMGRSSSQHSSPPSFQPFADTFRLYETRSRPINITAY